MSEVEADGMIRPSLLVQTVYFSEEDRETAAQLGQELYEILTRPANDPLAFGPGIPVLRAVSPEHVQLDAADDVVILPVLGKVTHMIVQSRETAVRAIKEWDSTLGPGHVIPIPTSVKWRGEEADIPGKHLLTELYGEGFNRHRTLDEIVLSLLRLLDPERGKTSLFVSHAKADLSETDHAAQAIYRYIANYTTGDAFFDVNDLLAGRSIARQIKESLTHGVFVAIRSDSYSSRDWSQKELLLAKQNSLPYLTVEVLTRGENLSSPYAGNGPAILWKGEPQEVVSRAMAECLRAAHFKREAQRTIDAAGLPDDTISLCRPPELLDLVQGPVKTSKAQTVIYPDPELPASLRALLRAAHPKIRLVTPTTAFRRMGNDRSIVRNPFDNRQIALSLSGSPDVNGPEGYTEEHIVDATVYLARSLISAGAHIAYGGDFRTGGYTEILASLIAAYRETAGGDEMLHSYLGSPIQMNDAPDDFPIAAHHMEKSPLADVALLPAFSDDADPKVPAALYFSDMRRVMASCTDARVLLGGDTRPQIKEENQPGYGGLYPGVVEEAWRSLQVGQPLYIAGGFGGAAGIAAKLLDENPTVHEHLLNGTWLCYDSYKVRIDTINQSEWRERLDLPETMEQLAEAIQTLGSKCLKSDTASIAWNGLSVEQNHELMRTRDPVRIAALVFQGLQRYYRNNAEPGSILDIELVYGSVTAASNVDALAIGVFDDLPLGGAGAEIDAMLSGKATLARSGGQVLVGLDSTEIDADWLYFASLGELGKVSDQKDLSARVEKAGHSTADQALRHGFSRIGVLAFGGTMMNDLDQSATTLLNTLKRLAGQSTIVWFENNEHRFNNLHRLFKGIDAVNVTTYEIAETAAVQQSSTHPVILSITLEDELLTSRVLLPGGTAVGGVNSTTLSKTDLETLSKGNPGRRTPDQGRLSEMGHELANRLLGQHASELLTKYPKSKVIVFHDIASSQLPFETLCSENTDHDNMVNPATTGGINRRLAVPELSLSQQISKPPRTGRLRVLLIVDPRSDLTGAVEEGEAVEKAVAGNDRIELIKLFQEEATVQAFKEAIQDADVLHYCGHAFYDGQGDEDSGLDLYDSPLFLSDLKTISFPVRVAFVNACESGRVRGKRTDATPESASFAEYFIRTGIDAYLGTYWKVEDDSAASFASSVYTHLSEGVTLDKAVIDARTLLHLQKKKEWANYILYGDGEFRLVTG